MGQLEAQEPQATQASVILYAMIFTSKLFPEIGYDNICKFNFNTKEQKINSFFR